MTGQEWREWRQRVERTETETRTVRVGNRTWQVRWTWQGRGTRQVRIVRVEQRRVGWEQGRWQEVRGHCQVKSGQVLSEVWD